MSLDDRTRSLRSSWAPYASRSADGFAKLKAAPDVANAGVIQGDHAAKGREPLVARGVRRGASCPTSVLMRFAGGPEQLLGRPAVVVTGLAAADALLYCGAHVRLVPPRHLLGPDRGGSTATRRRDPASEEPPRGTGPRSRINLSPPSQ